MRKQILRDIGEKVVAANNKYEKASKNVNILKDIINFGRTKFYPDFQNAVKQQRVAALELERAVAQYKYVELGGNNYKNSLGITHPVGSIVTLKQKPSTDLNDPKKNDESNKGFMGRFRKNKENETPEEVRYKIISSDGDAVKLVNLHNGESKYLTVGDANENNALESYDFKYIAKSPADGRTNKQRYADSYDDFKQQFPEGGTVAIYSATDFNNENNGIYNVVKNNNDTQEVTVERQFDGKLMNLGQENLISSNYYSFTQPNDQDYLNFRITVNGNNEPLPYPIN